MFTFGLFSTHLPYIAFVLFYGFFFLMGIEKASSGELYEEDRIIQQATSVSVDHDQDFDDNDVYIFNSFSGEIKFKQLQLYGDKLNLEYPGNTFIKTSGCRFSWFSRPPPVV